MDFNTVARDFLEQKRIAVVGVSSNQQATGNNIYKALQKQGKYTLFPVNPKAKTIEGDTCYPTLEAIPDGVDGAIIVTNPNVTESVMHDVVAAGVPRVWMHYNPLFGKGNSSVSEHAVDYGRENGVVVIDGGCPLMFDDVVHRCMRWVLDKTGNLPK